MSNIFTKTPHPGSAEWRYSMVFRELCLSGSLILLHLFLFKMPIILVSSYVILCMITTPFSTKFVFMPKYIF